MNVRSDDLRELQGRVVLVKSARDTHNPPTAMRGSLQVKVPAREGVPAVSVVLNVPDMFTSPAHERIIPLDERLLEQLIASENNGTYELVIPEELD